MFSFRPGSFLHAALPAWVLHAIRRFSGLCPPCYKPLFRPGSSMLHAAFDLAGYIALPVWVLSGSCIVHRELPAWFSLGHSGYTACFWSGCRRGPFCTRSASGLVLGWNILGTQCVSGLILGRDILGTQCVSGLILGPDIMGTLCFRPNFGPGHNGYTVCFWPDFGPEHNGYTACLRSEHGLGSVAAWCAFGLGLAWSVWVHASLPVCV